jgi:hypothetical protein
MIRRSILCVFGLWLFAVSLVASDLTGIWLGQDQDRRGEPQDLAFRFKQNGEALTGKMFGDEFDIAISEGSVSGDQIRFTVTTTNYYSGAKTVFVYTGTVKEGELELIRERVPTAEDKTANDKTANRPMAKQTLKLKRIDSHGR